MAKTEVIGKIVKSSAPVPCNSYAFTSANGRDYYFSIPDINEAKKYRVGMEVIFTPVAKGSRRFANDVRILMTESDLLRAFHLL